MKNNPRSLIAEQRVWASCVVFGVMLCTSTGGDAVKPPERSAVPLYRQEHAPIESRVRDLLSRMTLQEKVRQLDMYKGAVEFLDKPKDHTHTDPASAFQPQKALALLGNLGVGSIHDLYPTPTQSNVIQRWVIAHNRLGIPVLFIEEGLHGYNKGTVFPAPINLAATWDAELARRTGADIAAEARATGVDMILAPVLDLAREPRWGRVEEDFGEDPYLTGQLGLAYVQGAQGNRLDTDHTLVAEPKHFAGYGSAEGGNNTSPGHFGERELRMVMLKSFEPAMREGHAQGVMAAYHEIDGIPATDDPYLLKQILRQEWGFNGFVLSDLGAIRRLYDTHDVAATPKDAACMAIGAGVDMQFYDFSHDVFQNALIDCVHEGSLRETDLDRAVSSVLRVKFALGLFDHPYVDPNLAGRTIRSAAHLADSLQSSRESITLLKNEGALLPLSKSILRIAVIGPNGNVARYGDYEDEKNGEHISILNGIRSAAPTADVIFGDGANIPSAVEIAKQADIIIAALGEWHGISGEGFDRSDLGLPGDKPLRNYKPAVAQESLLEALVATGKPVVLVLENGRPLTIGWAMDHVQAIIEAWYPGEFGGKAIAETLFGDNNPSGHLTITFPQNVGQLPDFYNSDPSRKHQYVDSDGKPLFPFGFGLSYSSFSFTHFLVQGPAPGSNDAVRASVDVTNTGSREGDEVAQLYVREDVSSVETPRRSLAGFARVHLKPGATKTVQFRIPQSQLAVWNADRKWAVESGNYTLWAGDSSLASLKGAFRIQGNNSIRMEKHNQLVSKSARMKSQ